MIFHNQPPNHFVLRGIQIIRPHGLKVKKILSCEFDGIMLIILFFSPIFAE